MKTCLKCGGEFPLAEFSKARRNTCKPCHNIYSNARARAIRNGEWVPWANSALAGDPQACVSCGEVKPATREFFYGSTRHRSGVDTLCIPCKSAEGRDLARKDRIAAYVAYGGENFACACCGENTYEFLSIDHVNGGGNQHRKEIGNGRTTGRRMPQWLRLNGYPAGFQILCHSCNQAKGYFGSCPHERPLAPFIDKLVSAAASST